MHREYLLSRSHRRDILQAEQLNRSPEPHHVGPAPPIAGLRRDQDHPPSARTAPK
jgi:hypothetical protein